MRVCIGNGKFRTLLFSFCLVYIFTIKAWQYYLGESNVVRFLYFAVLIAMGVLGLLRNCRSVNYSKALLLLYYLYIVLLVVFKIGTFSNNILYVGIFDYLVTTLAFWFAFPVLENKRAEAILNVILVCGTFSAILGLLEFATGITFLENANYVFENGLGIKRSSGLLDSSLSYGCLVAITCIIAFALYLLRKKKIYLLICILTGIAVVASFSRGPMVSLAVAMFLVLFLYRKCSNERIGGRLIAAAIVVVVAISVFANFVDSSIIMNRITSIFDWSGDAGNSGRMYKWTTYLKIFSEHPIFGIGPNGCSTTGYGVAESGVLKRLVETGLVGAGLFYAFAISVIHKGISALHVSNKNTELIIGLGIVIFVLVEDVILQIFVSTMVSFLFWLGFALIEYGVNYGGEYAGDYIN